MVKILKGDLSRRVSMGSFKSIYQPAGWVLDDKDPQETGMESPNSGEGMSDPGSREPANSGSADNMGEDTLTSMSVEELKQYASLLQIKTRGITDRDQLIELIHNNQK